MTNSVNWFEIPVKDFQRAKKFYSSVLEVELKDDSMPEIEYGVFPHDPAEKGIGGAIVKMDGQEPSQSGSVVYLNGGDDLGVPLARVEAAGGKVVMPKTAIGENGFIAQFIDTEGNKVAFHSMN